MKFFTFPQGGTPYPDSDGPRQYLRMATLSTLFQDQPARVLVLGPDTGLVPARIVRDPLVKEVTWVNPYPFYSDMVLLQLLEKSKDPDSLPIRSLMVPERLYTRRTSGPFDLIVHPPSPLPRSRHEPLHTYDAYVEIKNLLGDRGVFCQWIFPHRLNHESFLSLLAAFTRAFPELYLFVDHCRSVRPALGLVGTSGEYSLSSTYIRERLEKSGRLTPFQEIGLDPNELAVIYLTREEMLKVRLPPHCATDRSGRTLPAWPDETRRNLLRNMFFLRELQVPSFPWFRIEGLEEPGRAGKIKYAYHLAQTSGIMLDASLGRTASVGFDRPVDMEGHYDLGLLEALELARSLSWTPDYFYLKALLIRKAGWLKGRRLFDASLELLENCMDQAPELKEFRLELAFLHFELEEYGMAAKLLESAPRPFQKDSVFLASLAAVKARLGELPAAAAILSRLSAPGKEKIGFLPWIHAAGEILEGRGKGIDPDALKKEATSAPPILRAFVLESVGQP